MKIGVPVQGENITEHFGHSPEFKFYEVDGKEIVNAEVLPSPGHTPGSIPRFLMEQGADVVLVCGLGERAVNLFRQNNIEVVTGANGPADENVKAFLEGRLQTDDSVCEHHHHHHNH